MCSKSDKWTMREKAFLRPCRRGYVEQYLIQVLDCRYCKRVVAIIMDESAAACNEKTMLLVAEERKALAQG